MPLIDVTYDGKVGEEVLRRLGELLPDVVGEAVECPEEPSTGPLEPGDIEIRFRKKSPLDVGDLDSGLPLGQIGVWLILSEGAWSQSAN